MKKQRVGSRIGMFVFAIVGIGLTTMVLEGEAGPRPLVALAEEESAVRSMLAPAEARVSPFVARPELDRMLWEGRRATATTPSLFRTPGPCDSETAFYSHEGGNEWIINTSDIWWCIYDHIASPYTEGRWDWALIAGDGTTELVTCGIVSGNIRASNPCSVAASYFVDEEYECEGDESFAFNYAYYPGGDGNWEGPIIDWNGPAYGCVD